MCGKQTQPVYISDAGVGEAVVEVKGGEAGSKARRLGVVARETLPHVVFTDMDDLASEDGAS